MTCSRGVKYLKICREEVEDEGRVSEQLSAPGLALPASARVPGELAQAAARSKGMQPESYVASRHWGKDISGGISPQQQGQILVTLDCLAHTACSAEVSYLLF